MRNHPNRGFALLVVIVISALVGTGLFAFRPKFLRGESKRATAQAKADTALAKVVNDNGAAVAASVTVIGEAAAELPDSKQKDFIAREVPPLLARLPAPDPNELLQAEKRKTAVLAGQLDTVNKLYAVELNNSETLKRKNDAATAAVKASNLALLESAAADQAKEHQLFLAAVVIGALVLLYLYKHFTTLPLSALGAAVANTRAGGDAITEIDAVTNRFEKSVVSFFAKLTTPNPSPAAATPVTPAPAPVATPAP